MTQPPRVADLFSAPAGVRGSEDELPESAGVEPGPDRKAGVRILYVLTAPFGLEKTLGGQLRYLKSAGFEPFFLCAPGLERQRFEASEGVSGEAIPIEREISPGRDLLTLWRLWRAMRRLRPQITNVSAPKAGLLGGLAAWLAGVGCRVYTLRGLRLETARGLKYALLWAAEWLACRAAHRVVCVSPGLARQVLELGLARPAQIIVPGAGSSNGVDAARFAPDPAKTPHIAELRRWLRLPADVPVVGYLGRLTRDKGIAELVDAYYRLRRRRPSLRLLLVGCFESGDPVAAATRRAIEDDPRIIVTGFVEDPALYYQLMDVVALPTYREGYPTVALEAAAACRPLVTTRVTGAADAVLDGKTGVLVAAGDSAALAAAIEALLDDPDRAAGLAFRALRRVTEEFSPPRVWKAFESLYRQLLRERAATSPWARSAAKRCLDVIAAGLGLLLAGPLLLCTAVLVWATMGRPILFRQARTGLRGKRFVIRKFRTMAAAPACGARPEAERLTATGRLLRRWSLDELPQLWNVLRGEMSLVGPRPLPLHYEPRYTARQRRRHQVRPGLSGWAQVQGRNQLSWEERFEQDLWYVEHARASVDLMILLRSVAIVLRGAGVSPRDGALMPEFLGETRKTA